MNGLKAALAEIAAIRDGVVAGGFGRAEAAICPPATLVAAAADLAKGSALAIGGRIAMPRPRAPIRAIFPLKC